MRYTGVSLEPSPGTWGRFSTAEENAVLVRVYEDDDFIALLKKYAEVANKSVLGSLNPIELGKFLALNGVILRAKRAFQERSKK